MKALLYFQTSVQKLAMALPRRFLTPAAISKLKRWARRGQNHRKNQRHFEHMVQLAQTEISNNNLSTADALKISLIVPVFNTSTAYLDDLIQSVIRQDYPNTELIFSDDGSNLDTTKAWLKNVADQPLVKVIWNETNLGISAATNAGINAASGIWIGLIDHDDALAPAALGLIARALNLAPRCQFLFTDEVITDAKLRPVDFFLKPAFDPVLLSGVNYINHLSLYRRSRLLALGGLRSGFQGSQDYDLLLRYTRDLDQHQILHLAYPAYLWRRDGASLSITSKDQAIAAARRTLAERYARLEYSPIIGPAVNADFHRVQFEGPGLNGSWPLISIIIPNRDSFELISKLLTDLQNKTNYPNFEVIIFDNGTTDPRVIQLYEAMAAASLHFKVEIEHAGFNFSKAINEGIRLSTGEAFLLLNNDIEIEDASWLTEMVSCLNYPKTGIVGAKLLYPDRTLQHAGVIVGLGDLAGHWFIGQNENFPGPMGRLWVRQSFSAVTGACMLVTRACFEKVGPFDEEIFPIAYNDVDFCLRARNLGFRIVWTPFAKLIHHESASRGSDETAENIARFNRDKENLQKRHKTALYDDPAFSPWLSRHHSEPSIATLEKIPSVRS